MNANQNHSLAETRLRKVKRFSLHISRICKVIFGLGILCIVGVCVMVISGAEFRFEVAGNQIEASSISLGYRIFLAAVMVGVLYFPMKVVAHLRRLFSGYAEGDIFTQGAVKELRDIGWNIIFAGVAHLLAPFVLHLVRSSGVLALENLNVDVQLGTFLAGSMILVISWVVDVAREINEEQLLTV